MQVANCLLSSVDPTTTHSTSLYGVAGCPRACPGSGTYGSALKSWTPDSGDPDECPPRRLTADLRYSAWVLLYAITRLRKGLHVPSVQVSVSLVGSSRGNIAEAHSILCEKTQNQLKNRSGFRRIIDTTSCKQRAV